MSKQIRAQQKVPESMVGISFDRGENCDFVATLGNADQQIEQRAPTLAKALPLEHADGIAWSSGVLPLGKVGLPTTRFLNGDVPDME